jgi:hypothetical protein
MALDASEKLGTPQIAGVRVNRRGFGKSIMARGSGGAGGVGGVLGRAMVSVWAGKKAKTEQSEAAVSSAPPFGKIAFLVLTEGELALIDTDSRTTVKLTDVLARVNRSEVTSIEVGKAGPMLAKPITVTFVNGQIWLLEVPAPLKRGAKKLANAFAGRA